MGGFITKTEVRENREYIVRTYGIMVYCYCVDCKTFQTFLGILIKFGKI